MGNEGSLPVDGVAFDAEEIKRLGKRFKKLVIKESLSTNYSFLQPRNPFSSESYNDNSKKIWSSMWKVQKIIAIPQTV